MAMEALLAAGPVTEAGVPPAGMSGMAGAFKGKGFGKSMGMGKMGAPWMDMSKGKGKGYGKQNDWSAHDWEIPGFGEALHEALGPYAAEEGTTVDDLAIKVGSKIIKAAKKFNTDERKDQRGTSTEAKVLIEEYVENCMSAVSGSFYNKSWFGKANLSGPLLASALFTFSGAKVFTRVLAPMLELFVQEGLFKWAEEERIGQGISTAMELAGVHESHRKKAKKHLETSFDEAHMKAPYGTTAADTTEMCMLQDFVKGWMTDFIGRAYDVMQYGIGNGNPTRDEQVLFITVLFQHLTSPENACLPSDLTALIENPPPCPWPFIAECAEAIFRERDAAQAEFKRAKTMTKAHNPWGIDANGLHGAGAGGGRNVVW